MSLFNVDEYGVITVDAQDIKSEFEEVYKQALDVNINLEAGTPQGQLLISDVNNLMYAQEEAVKLANSFTVRTANGKALDIAAQDWGYYRKSGQYTVVVCQCYGAEGTVIPAGSIVSDGTNRFRLLNSVTIPASGSIAGQFACEETGSIIANSNTVTEIITPVSGWDSVSNQAKGITGWDTESDNTFRTRITANWLNIRGKAILGAIVDNIAQLDGVISVLGRENMTDNVINVDGIEMPPHSIYLAIIGGDSNDIGRVIMEKKTLGANTVGDTEVKYYWSEAGVEYTYKIKRPDIVPIKLEVRYAENYYTPTNVDISIRQAIVEYVNQNPFMIGQTISGYEMAKALNGFDQIDLLSVRVALVEDESYTDYVSFHIDQVASLEESNIEIVEV